MTEITISTYQDYLDFADQQPIAVDETTCDVCGETLETHSDNVGFDENPKIETWVECPNGCPQQEGSYIL